ncbi:MAG TPA: hypothetical protein VI231_00590 [Candidatus Binatia bacterium]
MTVFCALTIIVPLFTSDYFPFSPMPMFSDSPRSLILFAAYLPDGTRADPARFGLQINYVANVHPKLSAHPPASLNGCTGVMGNTCYGDNLAPVDRLVSEDTLRRHVEPYLQKQSDIPWIRIEEKILAVDPASGGQRVAITDRGEWKIANPYYRG